MIPEVDFGKVPRRYLHVALVCLDQGVENYGFVILCNDALRECPQEDRDLLAETLEKFAATLRGVDGKQVQ
jgi:hypothetical protein